MFAFDASFWRQRPVFVTGHTGFKGAWLVLWLAGLGARVAGLSLPPYTDPTRCNSHYLGQPSPVVNAGSYRATSHFLSLALLYRYGS